MIITNHMTPKVKIEGVLDRAVSASEKRREEFRKRFPGILEFVTFEPRWRSVLEALEKVTF